jgi:lipopolysaccharide/colanic/teichoic acid biosynthesis glycosyltransferase
MIQKLFNFPKLHTMHVNGDEPLASFPDIHKDLALNNKLKRPLGYTPGILLRQTSLDELPALSNALHVEVSPVGCIYRFCRKSFIRCSKCSEYINEQKRVKFAATRLDRTDQRHARYRGHSY